jgi:integrase
MAYKGGHRRSWGWVAKQRSGRYLASYIGPDLARHYAGATYTSKLDAEAWLAGERRVIELDTWTPPVERQAQKRAATVTLDTYAQTWIEQRPLKPRTRDLYKGQLRLHIKDQLGNVPIGALSGQAVRAWYARLGTEHPTRNKQVYFLLHSICETAVKDQLLQRNPCQIERATHAPRKTEPVVLSIADLHAVADKIKPEQLKALVLLSAWCGLRWGEVAELKRSDIVLADGEPQVVRISRAFAHRNGCIVDTTKTAKPRAVVIPSHIRADVKHHLDRYVLKEADAQLFTAPKSCHYSDRLARESLKNAAKTVGAANIRLHDLRHFAGTQAARVGNLVETMQRLGHSTVKASLIYQSVVSGRDAEIAAGLSELAKAELAKQAEEAKKAG